MSHMKTLSVFLEGLLNKGNKTGLIPPEEVLVDAMTKDWSNMADIYHDQTMPTWVVEIKGDTAYIFGKDYNGKVVPVTCHIGPYTLNAIKNTKIKKIEALSFILRDKGNAVSRLSDISLHSTNKQPVFPFRFYETWELENVTFKSDSNLNSVEYFRYNRSLIIKKNVKLQNEMVNIAKIGDIETLGYDYSAVKRFKCIIPAENPLCNQIIKWLGQKKEGVAKDEDLKKLIGNIPPIATSYEYVIEQDSTWNIHMKIYNDSMMKFNRDPSWDWNGLHIQAYRQRGTNGKTYSFIGDPTYQYTKRRKTTKHSPYLYDI